MYAIYGNIYHQYTPVMLAYIPYIDPMGFKVFSTNNRSWYEIPYACDIVDHWFGTQTKWLYETCVSQNKYTILICKPNHGQIRKYT